MDTVTFRVLGFLLAGALGATAGCAAKNPPPPLVAPGARVELSHFSGTVLSGPTTQPVQTIGADQAWVVHVSWFALERMPRAALQSAGAQARLIVATQRGQPVLPSTKLTAASRWGVAAEADAFASALETGGVGRWGEIGTTRGALAPGMTLTARADSGTDNAPAPGAPDSGALAEVALSRPAASPGELQFALAMQDLIVPEVVDEVTDEDEALPAKSERAKERGHAKPRPAEAPVLQRELALVERVPFSAAGATAAFVAPLRLAGGGAEAVAAIVRVLPSESSPDFDALYAESMERVGRSIKHETARARVVSGGVDAAQSYRTVLDSLASPQHRRKSLVYLSDLTGAPICLDVAMVSDDATLEELSHSIREAASDPAVTADRGALGWAMDRAAFALLAARSGMEKVPPEVAAVLVSHAGEAGRHSGSMEEVLANAASRKDLDERLVAENFIFLEDNSPASRVRAYDWLRARGRAPEGYDPLASNRQRRDALERALEPAPATPAASTSPAISPAAATAANGGQR